MSSEHSPTKSGHTSADRYETYFTEVEAAKLLNLSRRSLQRWRQEGVGPKFRRFGGLVRYALSDIELWTADQARSSTSDVGHILA